MIDNDSLMAGCSRLLAGLCQAQGGCLNPHRLTAIRLSSEPPALAEASVALIATSVPKNSQGKSFCGIILYLSICFDYGL